MCRRLFLVTLVACELVAVSVHAQEVQQPPPTSLQANANAAALLAAADAALWGGDLVQARILFNRVMVEFPSSSEARAAERALRIMAVVAQGKARPSVLEAPGEGDVVVRDEPYSLRTQERLRLTAWEKLDFGVTSFLYGMSVGLSYSLSLQHATTSDVMPPIALGAIAYTLGAVAFLKLANPDRGDLPLALAITSYVPTTLMLVANTVSQHPNSRTVALATAGAGILSVPIAVLAAQKLDLDPGDTQLVRDAAFWGLALSVVGTVGFGWERETYTQTNPYGSYSYTTDHAPSNRSIAAAGLIGLYGGMGLGLVAAHYTDVSLERVRVSTWGGYGGAVLGLLLGAAADDTERGVFRGMAIGALAGLVVTFASTGSLDGIPEQPSQQHAWVRRFAPSLQQVVDKNGQSRPLVGIAGEL
jgi:hypothetical protein